MSLFCSLLENKGHNNKFGVQMFGQLSCPHRLECVHFRIIYIYICSIKEGKEEHLGHEVFADVRGQQRSHLSLMNNAKGPEKKSNIVI